jgi:homoserine kinase
VIDTRAVVAFAPGSIGNIGPGLDVLGCAVAGLGDEVTAAWRETPGIVIEDPGDPQLPADPSRHASAIAAEHVLRAARTHGVALPAPGLTLRVRKGLPLSGGQGGSAASAVAGAVAANALLPSPFERRSLLAPCLAAESAVAGRHLDNVAPSLLGGIVLVRSLDPIDVISLPVPNGLLVVLASPVQRLRTADARAVLPADVPRQVALHQMAQVAAMVSAFASGDLALLGRALDDRIAEPARAPLIRGFREAKAAALEAGALGASISGAGPTTFALAADRATAERVALALEAGFRGAGVFCAVRVTTIDREGARVSQQRAPVEVDR